MAEFFPAESMPILIYPGQIMVNPLLSIGARKKFCRAAEFGFAIYGEYGYGEEFRAILWQEFGVLSFGDSNFGEILQLSGIYQNRRSEIGRFSHRLKYYRPTDPKTEPQQTNREKFAAAIAAWQSLTNPQKLVYNERAKRKHLSGYNLKISEYMSS